MLFRLSGLMHRSSPFRRGAFNLHAAAALIRPNRRCHIELLMLRWRSMRGFTPVELVVVVAVVAILAAVALPTYRGYVNKSRRSEAQSYLMAVAARQQQCLLDTRAYTATLADIDVPVPGSIDIPPFTKANPAYRATMTIVAGPPPTLTVTATPAGDQSSEKCGELSINQTGRLPSLQISGAVGATYLVEQVAALPPTGNWTPLATLTLTNNLQTVMDTTLADGSQRFYRARLVP